MLYANKSCFGKHTLDIDQRSLARSPSFLDPFSFAPAKSASHPRRLEFIAHFDEMPFLKGNSARALIELLDIPMFNRRARTERAKVPHTFREFRFIVLSRWQK